MTALRALLAGIIDYAGLYPPAALDMPAAVRAYAAYRGDENAWMLGRFVLPVARLEEFEDAHAATAKPDHPEWRLSALLGADAESDLDLVRAFNRRLAGRAHIDSIEGRVPTVDAIERVASASTNDSFAVFAEVPIEPDPAPLIAAIKATGLAAKVRTGGVTADAIPATPLVVRFLRLCIESDVGFKATAGLHHPLRAEFPLTYEPGAPVGAMFGYLNVFLAAGFMKEGMSDADAALLLEERNSNNIDVTTAAIGWKDFRLTAAQLRRIRGSVAMSFGSCSFREPVDELRSLVLV